MVNTSATSLGYAKPATINKVSYTRYWNFDRQNVANLTSASMTLYYDLDDTVPDRNRVAVVHDDGSSRWVDYGGTGTANNTGSITSNAITSFKTKFALGFPPSPLPVKLISFIAKADGRKVLCNWETASEINNDYFMVERSPDGINYSTIGTVKGAGNNTSLAYYNFTDENPLNGNNYYRLKQNDFDGTFTFSDAEFVFMESKSEYVLFPNPSPGTIHIQKPGESMEHSKVMIRDMNGKEITYDVNLSDDKNELTIDIDPSKNKGIEFFVLNLMTDHGLIQEKIFVERK